MTIDYGAETRADLGDATHARGDARRAAIHDAALVEFTANGIKGASMARIAAHAGVSRPALYQYFANKHEIFASTFVTLMQDHVDLALAALRGADSTAEQLDGFLQRLGGDLWERLAASPHADEIESAKTGDVSDQVKAVFDHAWHGLDTHLAAACADTSAAAERRRGWLDLIQLGSRGLRADHPPVAVYRQRLRALAQSVAADVDSSPK